MFNVNVINNGKFYIAIQIYIPNKKYFSTFKKNSDTMGPQSPEGLTTLLILASVCVVILITAFSLTFFRKADTSDKKH